MEKQMSAKIKWSSAALDAYKRAGEQMKQLGCRAMREVKDVDGSTVLTFWFGLDDTIIQQTWTDTGDVLFYRSVSDNELEGMLSTVDSKVTA